MIFIFESGSNYPAITYDITDFNSVNRSNYDLTDWTGTFYLIPGSGSAVTGSIEISGTDAVSITLPTSLPVEFYSLYMEFTSGSFIMVRPDSIHEESAFVKIFDAGL